jgi:hypothetical protein
MLGKPPPFCMVALVCPNQCRPARPHIIVAHDQRWPLPNHANRIYRIAGSFRLQFAYRIADCDPPGFRVLLSASFRIPHYGIRTPHDPNWKSARVK